MRWLCVATATLWAFPCSTAGAGENLNFLIWENYVDAGILSDWSERTGVRVDPIYFDNGDARDAVLADPFNDVDLVILNENGIRLFGDNGTLQRIDATSVPAVAEYDAQWLDRCAGFGLPYLWGTMGILYRTDRVERVPTSWADLMKPEPELFGHVAMFNDTTESFVAPLVQLGASINSEDEAILRRAYELLREQANAVLSYDYVMTSSQDPAYGEEIWMALGYSGDQHALNEMFGTPGRWAYALPVEGSLFWLDCIGVASSGSPGRTRRALDLLDHIAGKESALRNARTLNMPTANREALAMLPPSIRDDPALYPPAEILAHSQTQAVLSAPATQIRRRIINALVNFRDAQ